MVYKYDVLKKEFESKIKNNLTDRAMINDFVRKYNLGHFRSDNKPTVSQIYNWYTAKSGHSISYWINNEVKKMKAKTESGTVTEPADEDSQPQEIAAATAPPQVQPIKNEPQAQPQPAPQATPMGIIGMDAVQENVAPAVQNANPVGTTEANTLFATEKKKILVELGRLGIIIADFENWIYKKWKLRPLNEQEREDTVSSIKTLVDNRIRIVSEYGDVVNVVITVGGHTASRIADSRFVAAEQRTEAPESRQFDPYAPLTLHNGSIV